MSTLPFKSRFNWTVVDGDPSRQITHNILSNEPSEPVSQDRLLNPDGCVVLATPDDSAKPVFCEQTVSVSPVYQVTRLALIAECAKLELHVGRTQEYYQTYQGELIFQTDDSQLYRFDVEFENTGIAEFMLRFITHPGEPLCLYGMHLLIERNTNPLGLLASDSTLNRAMLDCQLDDRKLSETAARCKAFIVASMRNRMFGSQNVVNNNPDAESGASTGTASDTSSSIRATGSGSETMAIGRYIDEKFRQLEASLEAKLQAIETRQSEKLDRILALLQGGKSNCDN
ncbi:conserved hypothetical protein [Culex quinquefasciatus]|uniref:Uncharacterized protein n=1 Tax=Culex quinquefasciatus TaxID=7176 RepID=B0WNC7_CULQU|nr:conserved hypothetical protein [Culex quinquefasciatus]|eukprot:XP_001850211.1 conserved hypothetical protein [Culex quinquefasciatus]